jgi:hypothetical protein
VRRLGQYVLAELGIVATALVGVGTAGRSLTGAIIDRWEERAERLNLEATALLPRSEISDPPDPRITDAAYRLNRLLGLNAVPPAAPRMVSRDELLAHLHPETQPLIPRIQAETIFNPFGKTAGVIMYWVPEIKDSGFDTPVGQQQTSQWLTQGFPIPVDKRPVAAQVSDLVVFDFLTANPDRYSGGNMKMSVDGSRLYFMDNTMAFFLDPMSHGRPRAVLQRTQRFSRHLYRALDRVSVVRLEQVLAQEADSPYEILTPSEMRAVVARRDAAKKHIDGLVALYGERNVLVFP